MKKYKDILTLLESDEVPIYQKKYCELIFELLTRYYKCLVIDNSYKGEEDFSIDILYATINQNYDFIETDKDDKDSFIRYRKNNKTKKIEAVPYKLCMKKNKLSFLDEFLLGYALTLYKKETHYKEGLSKFVKNIIFTDDDSMFLNYFSTEDKDIIFRLIECKKNCNSFFSKQKHIKYTFGTYKDNFINIYDSLTHLTVDHEEAFHTLLDKDFIELLYENITKEYPCCVLFGPLTRDLWYGHPRGKTDNDFFFSGEVRFPLVDLEKKIKSDLEFTGHFANEIKAIMPALKKPH